MGKAVEEADPRLFDELGIDGEKLVVKLREKIEEWTNAESIYSDIELPIRDDGLLESAKQRCSELGYRWGIPGLEAGNDVIHRHLTRDRSEVVLARAESAKRKALNREIPDRRSHR